MITYTYIVKCPNYDDEFFDFFDEAKGFALGCLSKKPIITQTEVNRNDFGECTDHCDLGTVWSWEDAVGKTEDEPAKSIFTKDDLKAYVPDEDPEFQDDGAITSFLNEDEQRLATNSKGEYLVRASSGLGYTVYNRSNVAIGGFEEDDDNTAITRFRRGNIKEAAEEPCRKPIAENAVRNGGFRADGYRTALACYDSDDFDINVEFGMQDEDEYEVKDQLYLLQPGQTVADLVVYLSRECGFTSIYVYGETSANREEIRTATRFTTVPGTHDYRDYGTIEDRLVEKCDKEDRKPVPEGMSLKDLVEAMEENEDTVECAGCEELFPKDECVHKDGIGWLCDECEDTVVKCTWCEELYDRSECRYEVDLKWLCDRCEAGIKSRGETLTFREGSYWDFLDEEANN